MKLLSNRLHVRPVVPDKIGSIVLPESLRASHVDSYKLYDVLQVGPGRITRRGMTVPVEAAAGDRVVCYSHTDGPITLRDGTSIITEDQILAVIPRQPVEPDYSKSFSP